MSLSQIIPLAPRRMTPAFAAVRVDPTALGISIDPFLAVDRFSMAGPTFPPHPHAGFSAVTYVLPESPGGMANRDSRGDHSLIPPGGLHWTAAGSGMLHEEIPAVLERPVEGLQIFVNHPADAKLDRPAIHHIEPGAVPIIALDDGGWVRVVAGRVGQTVAPFRPPTPTTLLDVRLAPRARFAWDGQNEPAQFTYVLNGALRTDGAETGRDALVLPLPDGSMSLTAGESGARLMLFAGRPLGEPVVWRGPFAMANGVQAEDAVRRYQSGAMGHLQPSPGFV